MLFNILFNIQGLYTDSILKYVSAPGVHVYKHPGAKIVDIMRGKKHRKFYTKKK